MNTALLVLSMGLLSAISWGTSDFFAAKSSKKLGPLISTILVFNMSSLVSVIIYVLFMRQPLNLDMAGLLYAAGAGVFTTVAAFLLFMGLSVGPVSIVSPLSSTYPLCTALLAVVAFHAQLSYTQIAGVVLVALGVTVASGLLTSKATARRITKGPAYGLLASLCFGVGFALQGQAIALISWQVVWLITSLVTIPILAVIILFMPTTENKSLSAAMKGITNPFIYGSVTASVLGFLAFNFGISQSAQTGGSVMTALSACYPIITIILALRHLDEKVHYIPLAGAVAGIVGVVVLSLG